jgi:3-hydroxybutyryl-CoA dehydrogenase
MSIDCVGIVGAGQTGRAIAHMASLAGFRVFLHDVRNEILKEAMGHITEKLNAAVAAGKLTDWVKEKTVKNIRVTEQYEDLANCDLVIEVVPEQEGIKIDVIEAIDSLLSQKGAIFASGTSSISITRLASITDRPEQFIGLNFIYPECPIVEVIRGWQTSDETFTQMKAFVEKLGKTALVCQDSPGFLVNRLLFPMINEAAFALSEGLGTPEMIDGAMTVGAFHPIGPLALADQIGLDICLDVMEVLFTEFGDTKYRPAPLLRKYVEAEWLGRKTGKGFFTYNDVTPIKG